MKRRFLTVISLLIPILMLGQTATIQFQAGALRSADGTEVSIGSQAVLVADLNQNGFITGFDAFGGTTLSPGNLLGGTGDELILGVLSAKDLGGFVGIAEQLSVSFSGGLESGDPLALYWFPTVTTGSIAGSVSEYGFYRSDIVDAGVGSTIAYIMPSSGGSDTLATFDTTFGGMASVADLTAVPEPSTYAAIVGLLSLGFVMWRRRR